MPECDKGIRKIREDGIKKLGDVQERFKGINSYLQKKIGSMFKD